MNQRYLVDGRSIDIVSRMNSAYPNFNWIPIALIERMRGGQVYKNVSGFIQWMESQPFIRYFNSDGCSRTVIIQTPNVNEFMYCLPDELDCDILDEDPRFTSLAITLNTHSESIDDIMLAYDPWIHDSLSYSCKVITRSNCSLADSFRLCNKSNVNEFIPQLRCNPTDHEIVSYILDINPEFSDQQICDRMRRIQLADSDRLKIFDDLISCDSIQYIRSSYDIKSQVHELDILIDRDAMNKFNTRSECHLRMSSRGVLIEFRCNTSKFNHALNLALKIGGCGVRSFNMESYY
jgi:hypothetical protein